PERVFVRVDVVVRTEEQRGLDVHDRVTRHHTCRQRFLNTLVHRGNVFARNHTALDGVHELIAAAGRQGLELQHDVAVLTATARLLDELAFDFFAGLADGFAVGDLGLAHVRFHAELTTHTVYEHFE